MTTSTVDNRAVQGGPAMPVYVANASTPVSETADTDIDTFYDGSIALSSTVPVQLNSGSLPLKRGVLVQNDPASATSIKVGTNFSQSLTLIAGASELIEIDNRNKVYVKLTAAGSATVNFHAE